MPEKPTVDDLPYELLTSIFLALATCISNRDRCGAAAGFIEDYPALSIQQSLLKTGVKGFVTKPYQQTVSHVCTRWRKIACAFAPLWTNIRCDARTAEERLATWLERSGNMPLDIVLQFMHTEHDDPLKPSVAQHDGFTRTIAAFWRLLSGHVSRCQRIQITAHCSRVTGDILAHLATSPPFPILRVLAVDGIHGCLAPPLPYARTPDAARAWSSTFPLITHLRINRHMTVPYGNRTFAQLVELHLRVRPGYGVSSWSALREALLQASKIVKLIISDCVFEEPLPGTFTVDNTVSLPTLTYLAVVAIKPEGVAHLMAKLSLPNLLSLSLSIQTADASAVCRAITTKGSDSFTGKLKDLALAIRCNYVEATALFRQCQAVENLIIDTVDDLPLEHDNANPWGHLIVFLEVRLDQMHISEYPGCFTRVSALTVKRPPIRDLQKVIRAIRYGRWEPLGVLLYAGHGEDFTDDDRVWLGRYVEHADLLHDHIRLCEVDISQIRGGRGGN